MDKLKVMSILAPYSPPLSASQLETIAAEISLVSAEELAAVLDTVAEAHKPFKKTRKSKLRK